MPKLHSGDDIPAEIVDRLRDATELSADETLLVIYDETTSGSGKAGFAITSERFIEFDGKRSEATAFEDVVRFELVQLELVRHQLAIERRVGERVREVVYLAPAERDTLEAVLRERLSDAFAVLSYEQAHNESMWRQRVYRGSGGMTLTTSPAIEGRKIMEYLGVVSGEAILGASFIKDIAAGITDLLGGRSVAYEQELCRAREVALRIMEDSGRRAGANAIIGIDIDFETIGPMLMVSCNGTAVTIE